jgi:DNA repair photolyase
LRFKHPVAIVTKSNLVLRDLDILGAMAAERLATVMISITTLDRDLARVMEPRAPTPDRRLDALRRLTEGGVPVGVLASPMIPAINDAEMERILAAAAGAGARSAGYILIRLPGEVRELFVEWLERHFPERRARVLSTLRAMHGGELYEAEFGTRMSGRGRFAELLAWRFRTAAARLGLNRREVDALDATRFRRPSETQLGLFG